MAQWLNGEAVAVGMLMAADLSVRLGLINHSLVERITALIRKSGLPTTAPSSMTLEIFLKAMHRDQKVDSGTLRLVLIHQLPNSYVTDDFQFKKLKETLNTICS